MPLSTILQMNDGYWLLLRGANHLPTNDPVDIARRIRALTDAPERYQYLVADIDANRLDFRLSVAEERRRLNECWDAEEREAESAAVPWSECAAA